MSRPVIEVIQEGIYKADIMQLQNKLKDTFMNDPEYKEVVDKTLPYDLHKLFKSVYDDKYKEFYKHDIKGLNTLITDKNKFSFNEDDITDRVVIAFKENYKNTEHKDYTDTGAFYNRCTLCAHFIYTNI